jgi:type III secretion system YscQ/HrcQ family protein
MSRGEAARRSRIARRLDLAALDRAASAARGLFGAAPALLTEPVGLCPSAMLDRVIPERCLAVLVAAPADPLRRRFVLELGSATARGLVDRLLGAASTYIEAPLSEGELGALLYAAARLVAEAGGGALQVLGVATTREALREALGAGDLAFWPVRFDLDGLEGALRVWLSDESLAGPPRARPPAALAALPLSLHLFRGRARLLVRELTELAPGDAVVLDEATEEGELLGEVEGSRRALLRCRLDHGQVVVQEIISGREAGSPGGTMNEAEVHQGLERAGDVEVELTVDVARLRLRLAELARLCAGEVLGTAVDVGAHVRLRAGELDVAEGELVDVEGKLGVLVTAVFPTAAQK